MGKIKNILLFVAIAFSASAQTEFYSTFTPPDAARDAFGNWRVSEGRVLFNAQFTYDARPLLFDTITVGSGYGIAYNSTNHDVELSLTTAPSGTEVAMQTFQFFRYTPKFSQNIAMTFNMGGGTANILKYAGYSDGENGIEFILNGTTPGMRILSTTGNGDETVTQDNWNLDAMDGTGASGDSLDFTKAQIFVIDFQALYVGRVRVGFDVGGQVHYVHEFLHANLTEEPYIASANLPLRIGMSCSGTVTDTIHFICSAVTEEGGSEQPSGVKHTTYATGTAGSGAFAHIIGVQPKTTFGGQTNRTTFVLKSVDLMVTGNNPVIFQLVYGQELTSTATGDVNATYSSFEWITGTISGTATVSAETFFIPASATTKAATSIEPTIRTPITLDHAGLQRTNGRLSVNAYGIGGTSTVYVAFNWVEQ